MSRSMKVNTIVTATLLHDGRWGIGSKGQIPWEIEEVQKFIASKISQAPEDKHNILVRGRIAFSSAPFASGHFGNCLQIILGDHKKAGYDSPQGNTYRFETGHESLKEVLETITFNPASIHEYWLAGGQKVYEEGLPLTDSLYFIGVFFPGNDDHNDNSPPMESVIDYDTFFPNDFKKMLDSKGRKATIMVECIRDWAEATELTTNRRVRYNITKYDVEPLENV